MSVALRPQSLKKWKSLFKDGNLKVENLRGNNEKKCQRISALSIINKKQSFMKKVK